VHAGDNLKKYLKKAKKYRNLNKFEAAENQYLMAVKEDPTSFDAHFELGLLYEAAFYDPSKALESFQKAEDVMKDTVYELYYHLGRAHHYFEDYGKAIEYYQLYKKGIESGSDGAIVTDHSIRKIKQAQFAKDYDKHSFDGMMVNLGDGVNSGFSEYVPVFIETDSSLLFTRRGTENLGDYYWDNLHYEDMFVSYYKNGELSKARSLKGITGSLNKINNTKKHEAVVDVSPGGDTLILYIKNKLWFSKFENDKWSEPEKFGKEINIAKYQRHACFTPDGKTMYFSSNDDEGKGGLDIYMSKLENGTWGQASNLGDLINTTGNEDSPFISEDGKTLYFSSTGHEGMGGYDMFSSELKDGKWSKPENMGTPVNSPADDIYLKIENEEQIYLSSNRKGGFGKMDIYEFKPYGIPQFRDCDEKTNEPYIVEAEGIHIEAFGKDTAYVNTMEIYEAAESKAGNDSITHYYWKYEEQEYEQFAYEMVFDEVGTEELVLEVIARDEDGFETHYCLTKEITVIEEPIIEVPTFALKPIYFDFDKYNIRKDADEVMSFNLEELINNPDVIIEVIGHTDSKGSDSYNMKLATKRANAAVKYLTKNGIPKDRIITIISKGESDPAAPNTNADGSDNPTNRQKNRRVEFKVVTNSQAFELTPANTDFLEDFQYWEIEEFDEDVY
jgi:outer membrane protein OmpA-like peptidoglycan-associated protein